MGCGADHLLVLKLEQRVRLASVVLLLLLLAVLFFSRKNR